MSATTATAPKPSSVVEQPASVSITASPVTEAPPLPRAATKVFYGWYMLPLAMLAMIASSPGQTFGVMVFSESIRTSLTLTHSQYALAYTLGTIIASLPITYFGWAMDRYGLRRAMLIATVMFAVACCFMAVVSNWILLLVAFTCLRMLGPGALAFLSGNTMAFWFERRLGMVEGIRSTSVAVSMTLAPILGLVLLHQFDWRGAYICFGLMSLLLLLPLFWKFFRSRPDEFQLGLDGDPLELHPQVTEAHHAKTKEEAARDFTLFEAFATPSFWIISAGIFQWALIQTALFFSMVPILAQQGFTEADAATLTTVFGISLLVMQLAGGVLADLFPARAQLSLGLFLFSAGLTTLAFADQVWMLVACGLLFGSGQGLFFGAAHPLWARYYGRTHLGKIRGCLMTIMVASSSLGPLVVGVYFDTFGNFTGILQTFMIAPLPVAVLTLFATKPSKRR